jgi:hypothetical protein
MKNIAVVERQPYIMQISFQGATSNSIPQQVFAYFDIVDYPASGVKNSN